MSFKLITFCGSIATINSISPTTYSITGQPTGNLTHSTITIRNLTYTYPHKRFYEQSTFIISSIMVAILCLMLVICVLICFKRSIHQSSDKDAPVIKKTFTMSIFSIDLHAQKCDVNGNNTNNNYKNNNIKLRELPKQFSILVSSLPPLPESLPKAEEISDDGNEKLYDKNIEL
eukprot:405164_1